MNKNKIREMKRYGLISILPHDNADVDALLASVLFSKLLDYLDIPNKIIIFDKAISSDTQYILDIVGISTNEFMVTDENEERNIFLIDHYVTTHKGKVIGCLDHHPNKENVTYEIYDNTKSCATAYKVFMYMQEFKMQVDKKIVEMLAYSMLVDTTGFLSSKTVQSETIVLRDLLKKYDMDYNKIREISFLHTDIKNMSINEIATNGLKTYNFKKGKVKASYIQPKDYKNDFLGMYSTIKNAIQSMIKEEKLELWVYIIYDLQNNATYVEYIYSNCVESVAYDRILSRGNDIMPEVEKIYN